MVRSVRSGVCKAEVLGTGDTEDVASGKLCELKRRVERGWESEEWKGGGPAGCYDRAVGELGPAFERVAAKSEVHRQLGDVQVFDIEGIDMRKTPAKGWKEDSARRLRLPGYLMAQFCGKEIIRSRET